jgi:hypothetical protein
MIELKANETKEITFSIDNKTIEFYTANNKRKEILMSLLVVVQQKHCRWIFNILTK